MTTDSRPRLGAGPSASTVLVRSQTPPAVSASRVVDVRPGRVATFDGSALRAPLLVDGDGERTTIHATAPGELEAAVTARLPLTAPAAVRFGDRELCRRVLPRAMADAVERRLRTTTAAAGTTLVTWTGGHVGVVDRRIYDVVRGRMAPDPE